MAGKKSGQFFEAKAGEEAEASLADYLGYIVRILRT